MHTRKLVRGRSTAELLHARPPNYGAIWAAIVRSPLAGVYVSSLRDEFYRLLRKHGLPVIRIQDLRHSFASYLVGKGSSILIVSELLGHANPAII